ncbi:MAG: hypothetical protein GQ544_07390 [Candidatus Aminicenantes bacterium]|nr:hypothetical protein [Candidatus Aminicenantes bacterium]
MNKTKVLITFCLILFLVLGIHAQNKEKDNLQELMNQILREKFDIILPQVMRENNIDMWIQVFREGNPDPLSSNLGSDSGVFIFTDRGGDRIERAVFGHASDLIQESGAYDIIAKPEFSFPLTAFPEYRVPLGDFYRMGGTEWPGGPKTELDFRFKGVGKFVAERNPKRIAVNYLEKLGSPVLYEIPRLRSDGISHTDYKLLVKALGDKYAERIVSAEYVITDFLSRPVKSEIVLYQRIREKLAKSFERQFNSIVPGKTRFGDLDGPRSVVDKDGNRHGRDYILQRGDLICLAGGDQSGGDVDPEWEFGNFHEVIFVYGYILREGESEPPPKIKRAWADVMKVRKILDKNIKAGRTAGETFEILKQKIEEAGYIYVNRQIFDTTQDLAITQVPLDLHAAAGIYPPRIGPLGPDWQREMKLPHNHHFYQEYWVFVPMPEWGEGKYLSIQLHDGVIATENGVEYFSPPPREIRLIK